MKIVGMEKVNYVSKTTGKPVKGTKLYYTVATDNVVGLKADSCYIAGAHEDCLDGINVGDAVTVYYDVYRNVIAVIKD